jgi:ubiquinone/menaquinone biosynthesis C-methylase UbiE
MNAWFFFGKSIKTLEDTMAEEGYDCDLNETIFADKRFKSLDNFNLSTQYFFQKQYILPNKFSMLDIGGCSGLFIEAIRNAEYNIDGTVVDPNKSAIEKGKVLFPKNIYMQDYFPTTNFNIPDNTYDLVSMQALFPQIPNWKSCIKEMCRVSKKFITFSLTFKLMGNTIVDKDVSYCYYLDSGIRVHQVIHNLYEFINFLSIGELKIKRIHFYGYHTPHTGHNFRCVPNSQQIKGNIFLELFEPGEKYPKRMGGASELKQDENTHKAIHNLDGDLEAYEFFRPELNIIIDNNAFDLLNS